MRSGIRTLTLFLALAATLVQAPPAEAAKKIRIVSYKSQTTFTFPNREGRPVYGLTVVLSGKATALTDPETGFAGPFRDLRGNGNGRLRLFNPVSAQSTEGEVTVTFRSDKKKKLRVKRWWWTDRKGKPVGQKKSGAEAGR